MSDSLLRTHRFRSDDPEEVSDFIGRIYADNQFTPQHAVRGNVNMSGHEWNGIGVYDVDYLMPFHFRSSEARPNYLFLSCRRGDAQYRSDGSDAACVVGDVMPVSSTGQSLCTTGSDGFGHLSVIIDAERVNRFLAQWVGQPGLDPVVFELTALAPELRNQWNSAADCLRRMIRMSPIPSVAAEALLEHMLKLLVTGHPNNHGELFDRAHCAPEHQTRIAIRMLEEAPLRWKTLGAIAHVLGCATEALENGIRRMTGKSSVELRNDARFKHVNRALARGDGADFVATLHAFGFSLTARFMREYYIRFGEPPGATYRRNPHAADDLVAPHAIASPLCAQAINRFIDASLESRIDAADLCRLVGMTERATIDAFRTQFSCTPAQYIIERRLERARWLLENTSDSILSIALNCGFGTHSYLSTAIRRHFGVTPRELRSHAASAQPSGEGGEAP
ncbi:helix-turn-helix domain-containing protein [Burkholderia cenocepacia]|uniref:AraC family transcriptional regulator n=1 Tax=Burkholderia cenocepacia TaxID=95486 RepID=UPI001905441A|nr:helix-turn-helix domain-containing protein [Burkholderia cenocepacia]MBJ9697474.1 helix-turn-helix domain-containing protein [Burkholderia cenocepacia]MBN3533991.1 helix-turn-helix domain-containing protein [Burkholderia cenocepacia]MBO1853235.1 helix-turn-helix domain-containing protein [Burkholderia cenocepacia]MBR8029673.1 helix-turn-helix domain-containing protein [Burkholderia cenocepacia]MBR8173497.1 helix-turn-helix domain-containing protein [Burkholderia cenocepacia]